MTGKIWAVIPVKRTGDAKQRLAGLLPAALRAGLALAMLEDVIEVVVGAPGLSGTLVVTSDPAAAAIAVRYGARVIPDDAESGHTAAVARAARRLAAERRGGMLQIPGDVPLVTPAEIASLLAAHTPAPAFTIAPARDDLGSNAVVVSPPDAVPLTFGDDSFRPHLRVAREHGIEPTVVRLPGIGLDIDLPADIGAFARLTSATRTYALMERHGLTSQRVAAGVDL